MSEILVTRSGMEGLNAELERLYGVRTRIVRRIKRALADGGAAAENGEYLDARHDRHMLELRISELERRRDAAAIVVPEKNGALEIGERVAVRDLATQEEFRYRIVGTGEADPSNGRLSHESPIGAALLGGFTGDVVEVDIPSGTLRLQVIDVDG